MLPVCFLQVLVGVCVCALQGLLERAGIRRVLAVIFGGVQSSTAQALCGNFALKVVRCGAEAASCFAFLLQFVGRCSHLRVRCVAIGQCST